MVRAGVLATLSVMIKAIISAVSQVLLLRLIKVASPWNDDGYENDEFEDDGACGCSPTTPNLAEQDTCPAVLAVFMPTALSYKARLCGQRN